MTKHVDCLKDIINHNIQIVSTVNVLRTNYAYIIVLKTY